MSSVLRRRSEQLAVAQKYREGNACTDDAIRRYLSAIDTPRSLTVWLLYKNGEHDQLTALDIEPRNYENSYRFRLDYCATNFLSKASFLRTSFDRKEVALKKFHEYETLCAETNNRFRRPELDPLNSGSNVWLLNATRRKISQILGDYSADELVDEANWGPGVSTLLKGAEVSAYNKFHAERGITRDLYALVSGWFPSAYPLWWKHLSHGLSDGECAFTVVAGNDIVTVPKNSKTDRVIAIEPGINLWFQKAIGSMIRRRLSRVGVDLNSQETNQRLAKYGSTLPYFEEGDFSLSTVDFSSASDSISLEVVRELLPPRWFQIMDACRSKIGMLATGPLRWNKFSSMGNGFTFELESLIFYAAASACVEYYAFEHNITVGRHSTDYWVNVFGDDVIIPSHAFSLFQSFSEFLGFRVNPKKSYFTGKFRESCGSHYFDGLVCKPVYLKDRLRHVEDLYKLANAIRRLAHRHCSFSGCDSRFHNVWSYLVDRVPEPLRFKVPDSAGDTGFVSNFDEACPPRARNGIEGYYYRALSSVGVSRRGDGDGLLLTRLWVQSELEYNNRYTLRGRSRRSISDSLVAQWYNLGPWE